ncbi:MAG: sulfurtransferase [Gammaproteobacteria bacterium]|nr:sulfurtransferase [Gammaproteobacteria bacterium]MDE2345770.1 sulfurtransferase [Gammaproteobacteria bacterium]
MIYTTLVDTETLAANLCSDWFLFDCRTVLADPQEGMRRYQAGHIPGAHYLHLDRDLAGPVTPRSGRHPLPEPGVLAARLQKLGVNNSSQVIAYDDAGGAFAARLWWLMRWLGHAQAAVLDGGIGKWSAEQRPLTRELPAASPAGDLVAYPDDTLWVDAAHVAEISLLPMARLLDARAPSRFRGEEEPIDPVAGHIPGAVNQPYAENVSQDMCFKSPAELRRRFETALAGAAPTDTVCMCGSGVTACHNLLAMEVAGLKGGRLYAGSWSEWIRDPRHGVERG